MRRYCVWLCRLLNGLWLWMDELLSADDLEPLPLDVVLYKLLVLMLLQKDETELDVLLLQMDDAELQLDEKELLPSDELALS